VKKGNPEEFNTLFDSRNGPDYIEPRPLSKYTYNHEVQPAAILFKSSADEELKELCRP
jgi:hypothetical protein